MKRQVAVSFEDDLVRVVYAYEGKGKLVVEKTIALHLGDLDHFLEKNRIPNLTVVYPFRKFHSDVIAAPPVKKAYLDAIIQEEIRKRYPDLKSFSFFYNVLADKPTEEKGARDVFFFAVDHAELDILVERFYRHGKKIKIICPDIVALSHILRSQDAGAPQTVFCLLTSNTDKSLFLFKNGYIRFIRITPSTGKDLQAEDIDNINMTISYCQQQLRVSPEQLVLLNSAGQDDQAKIILPTVHLAPPEGVTLPEDTFREYIRPLAAILSGDALKHSNLLPANCKILYIQRLVIAYAIVFYLLIGFLGLGCLAVNLAEISSVRGEIEILRKKMAGEASVITRYEKSAADLREMGPLLKLVQDARSGTDMEKMLRALGALPLEHVDIQSIQMNGRHDAFQMQITGTIHAETFENRHNAFHVLLHNLREKAMKTVFSQRMDLKNGQFQIELRNGTP